MEGFAELRTRYIRNSLARVEQVAQALDRLSIEPGNRDLVSDIVRHFHGFTGLGTTYGFPRVSELARSAEHRLKASGQSGATPDSELILFLRETLHEIDQEYRRDGKEAEESSSVEMKPAPLPKVLSIGSEQPFQQALRRSLEEEGFQLTIAETGDAAIAAFDGDDPPFAFITDVALLEGEAYTLIERVRATTAGEAAPAYVVSESNAFLDKVEAIRCGSTGYFEKPVDPVAITRRLRQELARVAEVQRRILSVEDDADQAEFIRLVLESAGYTVRTCADPTMFEADLTSFQPDLILLDINLGSMNGYELATFTRQNERYATLPIVFLSGETQLSARVRGVRAGGDDHLTKPLSPPLLLSTVAARIERAAFLQSLMERDGLTGLLTHTAFMERLKTRFAQYSRSPLIASLVMIDVDHFKSVNDTFGHPTGDRVLASLGSFLRRRLRQSDTLGRYGGEEFALLIEDLDENDAARLVSRLLEGFRSVEHRSTDGRNLKVAFSAGVATIAGQESITTWTATADRALYAAKARGRDQVVASATLQAG